MKIEDIEILGEKDLEFALVLKATRIMKNLKMSNKAIKTYKKKFLKKDKKLIKEGKKPTVIVAARIYMISLLLNENKIQEKIAIEANISNTGLRTNYKKMKEEKK